MKHPYADILIAIAEGKEIQWQMSNGKWAHQSPEGTLAEICSNAYDPERYRIKPATILINGVECEAPVNKSPAHELGGTQSLRISHPAKASKEICFTTPEACYAAYAALIKPFESAS